MIIIIETGRKVLICTIAASKSSFELKERKEKDYYFEALSYRVLHLHTNNQRPTNYYQFLLYTEAKKIILSQKQCLQN